MKNKLIVVLAGVVVAFGAATCMPSKDNTANNSENTADSNITPAPVQLALTVSLGTPATPTALAVEGGDAAGNVVDIQDFAITIREVSFESMNDGSDDDDHDGEDGDDHDGDDDDDRTNGLTDDSSTSSDDSTTSNDNDGIGSSLGEVEFKGPFEVDLMKEGNTVSGVIGDAEIPAGTYSGIKFEIAPATGATNPNLEGRSIYVSGTVDLNDGNGAQAFTMWHNVREEFWLTGTNGIAVDATTANNLVVDFDLAAVFAVLNFTGADLTEEISPNSVNTTNKALADAFKKALHLSADFGEDDDGDGHLEEYEDVNDDGAEDTKDDDNDTTNG